MCDLRVNCPVHTPEDRECGEYANAFRVLQDSGSEWFLDFIAYSDTEKQGTVVARIRVQEKMLSAIRDRLTATLREVSNPLSGLKPSKEVH